MSNELIQIIGTAIKNGVSGATSQVYFLYLPDQKLLNKLTVVWELKNDNNTDTFETREVVKNYRLEVKMNSKELSLFGSTSIYIKKAVYALQGVTIGHVHLDDEDLFYDDALEVYTTYLRFNLNT